MAKKRKGFNEAVIAQANKHLSSEKVDTQLLEKEIATLKSEASVAKETKVEVPVVEETKAEAPVVEETKAEAPVVKETKAEAPVVKETKGSKAKGKKTDSTSEDIYMAGQEFLTLQSLVNRYENGEKRNTAYISVPLSDETRKKLDLICNHYKINKSFTDYLLGYILDTYNDEIKKIFKSQLDIFK